MPRSRIVNVVGARPNLIKMAALVRELVKWPDIESVLVHTGQHYDDSMSDVFFRELGIPKADHNLGIGGGTSNWQTAQIMLAIEPLFGELKPDLVLVVGDVNSTVAATFVATRLGIPTAHVEAGLRSGDRTMPEEINRILTDALADYLFTTDRGAVENLRREGVPAEKIFFAGNVMIDTLLGQRERALALDAPGKLGLPPQGYALATLHRPSNVDVPEVLGGILNALEAIQRDLPLVFPVHPRTKKRLADFGLWERCQAMPNVRWMDPVGYLEALGLMASARLVLTDSGGIQEETTILEVPCLTLRDNTERPVTVTEGTNEIVGTSTARIVEAARRVLSSPVRTGRRPELWDGQAARRIVEILRERLRARATS